jgi:rRNA maturation RNase YbeY
MGRKSGLNIAVAGLSTLPSSARAASLYEKAVRVAFATARKTLSGEISIVFVTRSKMLQINRQYLGHDYDTDVITFQHDIPPSLPSAGLPIGDIFISSWMARRQAKELGHSVRVEAATLAAHGALHLLGHDDSKPRAKAKMFKIQDKIVASLRA